MRRGLMGGFRLLALIIAIWLILFMLKQWRRRRQAQVMLPTKRARMVRCAYCGVHIPGHEAVTHKRRHYCSDSHREAYLAGDHGPGGKPSL